MKRAKNWIGTCQSDGSHVECQEAHRDRQTKDTLPRRLLHVGLSTSQPRIAEELEPVSYCALSYCWGNKNLFITTQGHLSQNMGGISMDSIPAVMRDAIFAARSLEFQYIWIDALCIVQDDDKDWAYEAAIMDAVFSREVETFAAESRE
ncbi:hypothetical protein ACKRZS_011692 [Fusarium odoratissimum]|uniref:Heterokaryon incompatibility domain-containing protein n=3 Tax=Fusarium oxysporum species complex TaxID=171631 RepID=N1S0B9_FUSC4|nr:uncharacterized protein FOIG_15581 [Fusarium odoratissimum NRRL 54006]EMT72323.1 hypothetical protein FOC4_g10001773 [Fusarium odoratissimum]EXL91307.1 hypothetical protein FOIG_15581 [Fusarium odoratissimum NRRL 54006]KAK2132070.1 heterokaryon incompatibility protein-domain-containing protein [Fusarium oxysporum II5]TXC09167.1 hypothetical protein FocTR4_00006004 [Fusarium oxysporum f. sp. cubense]